MASAEISKDTSPIELNDLTTQLRNAMHKFIHWPEDPEKTEDAHVALMEAIVDCIEKGSHEQRVIAINYLWRGIVHDLAEKDS